MQRIGYETAYGTGILLYADGYLAGHLLPRGHPRKFTDLNDFSDMKLQRLGGKLQQYFAGGRMEFGQRDLCIDWSRWSPFEQKVARTMLAIPYGGTICYSDLASAAGYPGAQRAVGNFMTKNPFPLIFPCHRVIRRSGQAGNYSAGSDWKKRLLELEAAHL